MSLEEIIDKCSNCLSEFFRELGIIIIEDKVNLCHNCISKFVQKADIKYLGLDNIKEEILAVLEE